MLRTRPSKASIAAFKPGSLLRPSFSTRRSSRSLFRKSQRKSGVSFEISVEPDPAFPADVPEEEEEPVVLSPSNSFEPTFGGDILDTVPGVTGADEMISIERDGRTVWIPAHIIDQYAASAAAAPSRPGSAGRLRISIPDRTTSRQQIKQQFSLLTSGEHAAPVSRTVSETSSSSPGGSPRSKGGSFSDASSQSPTAGTPDSIYSSAGTSLTSLDLQTPVDNKPVTVGAKTYVVPDPTQAGVFDDQLSPSSLKSRQPRPADLDNAPAQEQNAPPVPQRSRRRPEAPKPLKRTLTKNRSMGDMSLAVINEKPTEEDHLTSETAETVIFKIFLAAHTLPDLFALAQANHGFYAVYKRNEDVLVRNALRNDCIAAWELREASDDEAADSSPAARTHAYLAALRRDIEILEELKTAVLDRCRSFLRPATIAALSGLDATDERSADEAFWRIWTFCTLFGARPADIAAQTAWLRDTRTDSGSGALSAAQLYDMTELWNCIAALLSRVASAPDAVTQARAHGVLSPEEPDAALDAWLDAQLVRGPAVALELAAVAAEPSADVFAFAAQMGWTSRAVDAAGAGARAAFFKDAVSRVYSERLAEEREAKVPELEIASPTPISPARASPLSGLEPDLGGPLERGDAPPAYVDAPEQVVVDQSNIHPALRQAVGKERFVTPPTVMMSGASSVYSTRPVTPVY